VSAIQNRIHVEFADLFQPIDNPGARAVLQLLASPPPNELIGNVYVLPYIGDDWIYIVEENRGPKFPGGKIEPQENYMNAARRELQEEAGAELINYTVFAAWYTHSKSEKPHRPHLPHPVSYGLLGYGEVALTGEPTNPEGAGKTVSVKQGQLSDVVKEFTADQLSGMSTYCGQLYRMAARLRALAGKPSHAADCEDAAADA